MSENGLALRGQQQAGILPAANDWAVMLQMADVLCQSGLMPSHVKSPAAAVAVIQKGRELGIPPMYALSNIAVIQGKPTANAELMAAMIYRDHGDDALIYEVTDASECAISYKRRAWSERKTYAFTMEDAKKAGLLSNQTWQKYPAAMLRARCVSAVARLAFPDSIGGMYTPEELGAHVEVDAEGVVQYTPPPAAVRADSDGVVIEQAPAPMPAKPQVDPATVAVTSRSREAVMARAIDKGVMPSQLDAKVKELTGKATLDDCTEAEARTVAAWVKDHVTKEDAKAAADEILQRELAAADLDANKNPDPNDDPFAATPDATPKLKK